MQDGSHTKPAKACSKRETLIPIIAKIRAMVQMIIKIQHDKLDSYQGIIAFLKNGF